MQHGKIIKTFKSKKGTNVTFRYLRPEDLDQILVYANNLIAEDTFVLLSGEPITREGEAEFLNERFKNIEKGNEISLVVETNDRIIGMAGLERGKYRKHHVGMPGISLDKAYRGEGIGEILFRTLIDEAKKMGLRLLVLGCFENNVGALNLYKKLGFKKIGIEPGAIFFKGKYINEVDMYLPLA